MSSLPPTDAADALQGTVLYIEDEPTNVVVVEALMRQYPDLHFLHAATGLEGVRRVRDEHPDFVLLDMHLPDISGLEVVRLLNEDISARGLRVVILTADRLSMDIIKAMSLGAWEYWIKPIDARVLATGLSRAFSGRQADPARLLHRRAPPLGEREA